MKHNYYPDWVFRIILDEREILLQRGVEKPIKEEFLKTFDVDLLLLWRETRQGAEIWMDVYGKNYESLKFRAEKNGYKTSDSLFNKDGKLDYVKLPS